MDQMQNCIRELNLAIVKIKHSPSKTPFRSSKIFEDSVKHSLEILVKTINWVPQETESSFTNSIEPDLTEIYMFSGSDQGVHIIL